MNTKCVDTVPLEGSYDCEVALAEHIYIEWMHNNSGPIEIYIQEIYVFEVPDLAKTMAQIVTNNVYSGNADANSIFQWVDWSLYMDYTATFTGGLYIDYYYSGDNVSTIRDFTVLIINNESTHTSDVTFPTMF